MKIDCPKYQENLVKLKKLFSDFQIKLKQGDIKKAKQLKGTINEAMIDFSRDEYEFFEKLNDNLDRYLDGKVNEEFDLMGHIHTTFSGNKSLVDILTPRLFEVEEVDVATVQISINQTLITSVAFSFDCLERSIFFTIYDARQIGVDFGPLIDKFVKEYF